MCSVALPNCENKAKFYWMNKGDGEGGRRRINIINSGTYHISGDIWNFLFRKILWLTSFFIILQNLVPFSQLDRATNTLSTVSLITTTMYLSSWSRERRGKMTNSVFLKVNQRCWLVAASKTFPWRWDMRNTRINICISTFIEVMSISSFSVCFPKLFGHHKASPFYLKFFSFLTKIF